MASKQAHAGVPHAAAPLSVQDWQCGVCLELLYKPCVAPPCGHIYCFWCMHKSMDGRDVSRCPICRAHHDRLPRVCTLLTSYLLRQYPAESAARAAEVKGEEAAWGVQAAEVDDLMPDAVPLDPSGDAEASAAVGMYTPTTGDFQCSHPNCSQLLIQPRVPVCGHPVCSLECLARDSAGMMCCPLCRLPVGPAPAVCRQLGTLVAALFPETAQQMQRMLPPPARAEATVAAEAMADPTPSGVNTNTSAAQPQGGAASPVGESSVDEPLSGRHIDIQRALREYVHFGIGCDCCGAYPIRGKRYKCVDCPEAVGFDLCEACHHGGIASFGRFNQRHVAGHRMLEQKPVYDVLHLLKVLHPEKSFTELHQLLRFAAVRHRHVPLPAAAAAEDAQPPTAAEDSQPAASTGDTPHAAAADGSQQADGDAEAGSSQPAAVEPDTEDAHDGDTGGPIAIMLDPASAADLRALAHQISQQQAQAAAEASNAMHGDAAA